MFWLKTLRYALPMAAFVLAAPPAQSEGFLVGKPEKLPDLVLGTDDSGYKVSQATYSLETGKGYRLAIVATGKKPYAVHGNDFFQNIWLRKVEVEDVEIKALGLVELEMEKEGKVEIFFVPIRPGEYKLGAKGLESKGTVTTFVVR